VGATVGAEDVGVVVGDTVGGDTTGVAVGGELGTAVGLLEGHTIESITEPFLLIQGAICLSALHLDTLTVCPEN